MSEASCGKLTVITSRFSRASQPARKACRRAERARRGWFVSPDLRPKNFDKRDIGSLRWCNA